MTAGNNSGPLSPVSQLLHIAGAAVRLEISPAGEDNWLALLDGKAVRVDARLVQPGILSLIVEGQAYRCFLDEGPVETAIRIDGRRYPVAIDDPRSLASRRKLGGPGGVQIIKAPMPGRVVRVLAAVGDLVAARQGIVVVEAMKMQNELKALREGRIVEVRAEPGATVAAGAVLVVIE